MKDLTKLARREDDPAQLYIMASDEDVSPKTHFAPVTLKLDYRLTSEYLLKEIRETLFQVDAEINAYETGKGKRSESTPYVEYVPITPYIL